MSTRSSPRWCATADRPKPCSPQFGSAAINAGSDASATGLATDQRGQPRISGTHVDIGAVGRFQAGLMVSSSKMDSGENTLRAALLHNSPRLHHHFRPESFQPGHPC